MKAKIIAVLRPFWRRWQLWRARGLGPRALQGRKVYDLILFNQELELLEARLSYLDPLVDVFVIGESNGNFVGEAKPLYFQENRERFKKFWPKIRHYVLPPPAPGDYEANPMLAGSRTAEFYYRRVLAGALADAADQDILLYSDADEIPRRAAIRTLAGLLALGREAALLQMEWHLLYLNAKAATYANAPDGAPCVWLGTIGTTAGTFQRRFGGDFNQLWQFRWGGSRGVLPEIPAGGWHLSYMGGLARLRQKQRDCAIPMPADEWAALRRHEFVGVKFQFHELAGLFPAEFSAHLACLQPFAITPAAADREFEQPLA